MFKSRPCPVQVGGWICDSGKPGDLHHLRKGGSPRRYNAGQPGDCCRRSAAPRRTSVGPARAPRRPDPDYWSFGTGWQPVGLRARRRDRLRVHGCPADEADADPRHCGRSRFSAARPNRRKHTSKVGHSAAWAWQTSAQFGSHCRASHDHGGRIACRDEDCGSGRCGARPTVVWGQSIENALANRA